MKIKWRIVLALALAALGGHDIALIIVQHVLDMDVSWRRYAWPPVELIGAYLLLTLDFELDRQ